MEAAIFENKLRAPPTQRVKYYYIAQSFYLSMEVQICKLNRLRLYNEL